MQPTSPTPQGPPQGGAMPPSSMPGQGPTGPAAPPNPHQTMGIILAVCAGLLLIALFSKSWCTASEGRDEAHGGLMGFEGCGRGMCVDVPWDKAAKQLNIGGDVGAVRILALLAGFGAVGGLGYAAAMLLTRKPANVPVQAIQTVMGLAAFGTTFFTIRLSMSDRDMNFGPGWAAILGIGALVAAGIVMQQMVRPAVTRAKAQGPAQPAYATPAQMPAQAQAPYAQPQTPAHPAPAMAATPMAAPSACPRCGHGIEYVAQYQRYFCRTCNQYV